MTVSVVYDRSTGLIRIVVEGDITVEDMASTFRRLTASDDFPMSAHAVWDLSRANFHNLDFDALKATGQERRQYNAVRRDCRIAVVVSLEADAKLVTLYGELAEIPPSRLRVFFTTGLAEQWAMNGDEG